MEVDNTVRVQVMTNKSLVGVASIVAAQYEKFAGWLVAGLGASLALLVSNLDKTKDMIQPASAGYAIKIFVAILIAHTAQKILAIVVSSGATSLQSDAAAGMEPPLTMPELSAFLANLENAYPWPLSAMVRRSFNRMHKGKLTFFGKMIARLSLWSAGLAALQILLAIWLVLVLARGLP
ncbi:hypothetical protein J2W27_001031 [Variovorax boronicumulans]|uniref:hypothetical protein n=1 Tax=Variovorax boronicumulans TaxID=436515 RepID=UPI00277ED50D|nr:hypothetical protein [Variovorax boronicumulans]MDP9908929.1 hypothetical protein [Variovorax boronicumulans]